MSQSYNLPSNMLLSEPPSPQPREPTLQAVKPKDLKPRLTDFLSYRLKDPSANPVGPTLKIQLDLTTSHHFLHHHASPSRWIPCSNNCTSFQTPLPTSCRAPQSPCSARQHRMVLSTWRTCYSSVQTSKASCPIKRKAKFLLAKLQGPKWSDS